MDQNLKKLVKFFKLYSSVKTYETIEGFLCIAHACHQVQSYCVNNLKAAIYFDLDVTEWTTAHY